MESRRNINSIKSKTAHNLASILMSDDAYHNRIASDAKTIVNAGLGDYQYIGQSGATSWRDEAYTVIVNVSHGAITPFWKKESTVVV